MSNEPKSGPIRVTLLNGFYQDYEDLRDIVYSWENVRLTVKGRKSFVGVKRKEHTVDRYDMNGPERVMKIEFL